ncbi:MAG: PilZ domain-containing protein [Acidobacteria bacterium]|nr:MAG: PilZ domain-containing protein [Acidobacteriota bacterium]
MTTSLVVLIASAAVVDRLKDETYILKNVLMFADTDVALAFQAILRRHPSLVVLQRDLLGTPRMAELLGQIRTDPDPTISRLQIRVTSNVKDYMQLISRLEQAGLDAALEVSGDPLPSEYEDQQWARRFRTHAGVEVQVAGTAAKLADLSLTGAQLILPRYLRPNQQVRILITDGQQVLSLAATVVRSSMEPARDSATAPHYRAGVTFIDADREALETFCARNQQQDRDEP